MSEIMANNNWTVEGIIFGFVMGFNIGMFIRDRMFYTIKKYKGGKS